ncbi:MAG: hypothetical protein ACOH2H_20400 [Cypionkella sp.]
MSKRDESAIMVAKLVNQLSENGLAKTEVASRDFLPEGADQKQIQLFADTVKWLQDEGVVRDHDSYADGLGGIVFDLVLTSRGFWLLDQKFSGDLTLGSAISKVAKNEPMTAGLGDFVGGILGGFTKSITG